MHARAQNEEEHSLERVWYTASREPSDTPPGSQLDRICTQRHNIYPTVFSGLSSFPIGTADAAWGVLGSVQSTRLENISRSPLVHLNLVRFFRLSLPLPVFGRLFPFLDPRGHVKLIFHLSLCLPNFSGYLQIRYLDAISRGASRRKLFIVLSPHSVPLFHPLVIRGPNKIKGSKAIFGYTESHIRVLLLNT